MTTVDVTIKAVVDKLHETMDYPVTLCNELPTTFELMNIYVMMPEQVTVNHMINSGSFQEFDIEIVVPVHESNSDRLDTLSKNVLSSLEEINQIMYKTFNRIRIIGGGCNSGIDYSVQNWEVQGFIYATADITLHFKSILPY